MIAEQWAIYWWSISTNIQCGLIALGAGIMLFGVIMFPVFSMMEDDDKFPIQKIVYSLIVGILMCLLGGLVPSKQDLALIFAYPYMKAGVEQAAQSETVKKLTTISTKYLDKVIADLEKTNDNK